MITIRYFAAAAAALGIDEETITQANAPNIGAIVQQRSATSLAAAQVLARCSFIVDGKATRDLSYPLNSGSKLDVLPPFAGG